MTFLLIAAAFAVGVYVGHRFWPQVVTVVQKAEAEVKDLAKKV